MVPVCELGHGMTESEAVSRSLEDEVAHLRVRLAHLERENCQLQDKLNAALDGTGICLWQGWIPTGELTVFNLQNFHAGQMAPSFELWQAKLHPEDQQQALANYYDHLAGKLPFYEAEYRTVAPDGQVTWLWDRGRVIERDWNGHPLRIMGSHIDITQRKEYKLRLAQQAQTDPLTGLYNRQAFLDVSSQQMAQANGEQALLFIDLDDFKAVNDRWGHSSGDRLLLRVASWLRDVAPTNALLARMGGDEFVIYLPQMPNQQSVIQVAERLLACCGELTSLEGHAVRIGMSIGITFWSSHSVGYELALDSADRAMYGAKQRGKLSYQLVELG